MVDILENIMATKRLEVASAKKMLSISQLEDQIDTRAFEKISLARALMEKPGIIAEFKRASPSKGIINATSDVVEIVNGYAINGATAISVLTDKTYFKAKFIDFKTARTTTDKPLLRKEFIIDEYQLYESKAMGANVILLIAAILTKMEIKSFTKTAHSLGLEVLIEIHAQLELNKLSGLEDIIGVNNRNLKTFEVDIHQSIYIRKRLGNVNSIPLISESGLSGIKEISILLEEGFNGFLLGEYFMKQKDPVQAFAKLNNDLKALS